MGIVILNTGHLGTTHFIKYFGSYMMVFGIVNLIYAMHNNEQSRDYQTEKLAAKKAKISNVSPKIEVSKRSTTVKQSVKKTAKKSTKKITK